MTMTRRDVVRSGCALMGASLIPGRARSAGATTDQPSPGASAIGEAVCLSDFEAIARERISHMAFEYISGGAGDEITLQWNREAWGRIRLRQRVLVDVSNIDTRVRLFGRELPFPIVLAPTAHHRLYHPEGELATIRGAGAAGAVLVVSSMATTSVEAIAAGAAPAQPPWFQLYIPPDRSFTRDLVHRAERAGCQALCVTVDSPVIGLRHRETRSRFALPEGMGLPHLEGLKSAAAPDHRMRAGEIYSSVFDPKLSWKDIEWLRSVARIPVLLKGITNPDDAARAVAVGVSGIIVSNHGGRNLDTLPATAEALPEVVEKVAGRVPILVDGGIRRGTDVLKALALGASAVLIGRPYLYGLGAAGSEGVARVVTILRREFEMALALTGRTSLAQIDRSVLWPSRP
jgi:4-hydroxymandelate oxidase